MTSDPPRQLELVINEGTVSAVHGSLAAGNIYTYISSSGSLRSQVSQTPHTTTAGEYVCLDCMSY